MSETMTPARFIRECIFKVPTQEEFALMLGYKAPNINRFENGRPISTQAQERIRKLARRKRVEWDNNWFFEVPKRMTASRSNGIAA